MKKALNFVRENCARIATTGLMVWLGLHWGILGLGFFLIMGAVALWC